jgi:hypothetical protein
MNESVRRKSQVSPRGEDSFFRRFLDDDTRMLLLSIIGVIVLFASAMLIRV